MKLFRTKFRKRFEGITYNTIEYKKWYQRKWHILKNCQGFTLYLNKYDVDDVIFGLKQAKF